MQIYILQNQPANEDVLQQKVAFFLRVVWKVLNRLIFHLNFYRSSTILITSSLGNPMWLRWRGGSEYSTFTLKAEPQKFAFHNMISLNSYINLHLGLCYISWMYSPAFYIPPGICLYRVLQTFLPTHLILWSWQLSTHAGTEVIYSFRSVKHLQLATSDCANIQIFCYCFIQIGFLILKDFLRWLLWK